MNRRNYVMRAWGYSREWRCEEEQRKESSFVVQSCERKGEKKVAPISLDRSASKAFEPSLHSRLGGFECRFAAVKKVRRN